MRSVPTRGQLGLRETNRGLGFAGSATGMTVPWSTGLVGGAMFEPPKRGLNAERDELARHVDRRRDWMRREHGMSPDKSAMVRPIRDGFCRCAHCESVRRRIDGDI